MSLAAALRVEKAGPLALLQDGGRFGVRHLGITQGGPMDWHAAGWANALLGNDPGAAVLEVAIGGLTLVAEAELTLSLCGADLSASVNGQKLRPWQRFTLQAGDRLAFGMPRCGVRAYLGACGGWQGVPALGSVACVGREGFGGHKGGGRPLDDGDQLQSEARSQPLHLFSCVPPEYQPDYGQPAELGVIPGSQTAFFDGASLYEAFNAPWQVDTRADRMGIRLTGPELVCHHPGMVSEGLAAGAIQVPPDGQPICLMNDRQTIGGYPRLGTLTPLARARLAQCQTGETVRLRATGTGRARQEYLVAQKAIGSFQSQ